MDQTRRHVFHASAYGVSARIRRPVDLTIPVQAATALPVTGGLSESQVGPQTFDKYLSFQSASSRSHGDYADLAQAVEMTHGRAPFDSPTVTTVSAEVTGMVVIGRVSIDRAAMGMVARTIGPNGGEPSIIAQNSALEGIKVDGYPVRATLAEDFFSVYDTMSKLSKAINEGSAPPELLFTAGGAAAYGFSNPNRTVMGTLVRQLAWDGDPNPNATIDGNCIIIPNYGKVFFGEIFISADSRRVTMVRFQLGSDDGGTTDTTGGTTGTSTWPPTGP